MSEVRLCVNCNARIRYVNAPLGGAWQHIASMSIYCGDGSNAELKAKPGVLARPR